MEYLNGYTLAAAAIGVLLFACWLMRAKPDRPTTAQKPRIVPAADLAEMKGNARPVREPIQVYDRFPEPKPLKTIEIREAKDGIPWP